MNAWLDRIAQHAVPMLTDMAGAAYVVQTTPMGTFGVASAAAKVVGLSNATAEQIMSDLQATVSNVKAAGAARFLRAGPCGSGSEIFRAVQPDAHRGPLANRVGVADFSVVIAAQPESAAVVLAGAQPALSSMSRVMVRRWSKVSAHLSAGYRLMNLCAKRGVEPADNEAVLESTGKVAHADGQAASKDALSRLRTAAKAIDRARSRARAEPDEALELWRGLVAGRWSLVDQFDSDGRRYIVARKNEPLVEDPRHLSLRERQVAAYTALGQSGKMVAYALGLSESTVAIHLASALRKLGLWSRVELASLFTASLPNPGIDDGAPEKCPH